MQPQEKGYYNVTVGSAKPGDRYAFSMDGQTPRPDPASRSQPEGVQHFSEITDKTFSWTDQNWQGLAKTQLTIYELHVGTFSAEGTFRGVIPHLSKLAELGVTAIELMPVAQFPGKRNWGYDGVFPFAAQNSYGGPFQLKELVNACHRHGLAILLDVVYNHLGPEGNILPLFAPYFQNRYHTPWGDAINYDGPYSDEVKKYFTYNMIQWLSEFHFDGLRLDAIHAILDESQHPLLQILSEVKAEIEKERGIPLCLIGESDLNDPKVLRSFDHGGYGLDQQWNDDFHHSLHVELTGEKSGYYEDFNGLRDLAKAYTEGTVYQDEYSAFRKCSRGRDFSDIEKHRLVVYSQNHDQIGNRPLGERLIVTAGLAKQRLAAACVFLSPFTPLIFMGEELGETAPFQYFVDHQEKDLIEAVRKGRRNEFKDFFKARGEQESEIPDPASPLTFQQCILDHERIKTDSEARRQFSLYQSLIKLSQWIRREKFFESKNSVVHLSNQNKVLQIRGQQNTTTIVALLSFQEESCLEYVHASDAEGKTPNFEILMDTSFHYHPGTLWNESKIHLPGYAALLLLLQENL
jgi:maltooligosyltrehalose trehalohydrolase